MSLKLFDRAAACPPNARPALESLEERTVPAAGLLPGPALGHALVANLAAPAAAPLQQTPNLPISINSVSVVNGGLVASGLVGGIPFTTPVTVSPAANSTSTVPILDLQLAPIHLDLLGLTVDTSKICLDVTAQTGQGKLLGNLLADVANLLNGGTSLANILGGLSTSQIHTLDKGLTTLFRQGFRALDTTASPTTGPGNVLNLSLGPVNLDVLGLNVSLDNCSGGPVTVSVSAVPGSGNLLGNLVYDLIHLLDNGLPPLSSLGQDIHAVESILNDFHLGGLLGLI